MSLPSLRRTAAYGFLIVASLAFGLNCTSEGNGGTEPGPNPAISISVSPASLTIPQGGSGDVTGTLTRSGGFTGAVAFTVEGNPAGVTGALSNESTSGGVTTATITISAAATTVPGVYTLTVRAAGSGVSPVSGTFELTVTGFLLSLDRSADTLAQGEGRGVEIFVEAMGFTGDISYTLEGVPAGVTVDLDPVNAAFFFLNVGEAAAPGEYPLTLRGMATGLPDQTVAFTLTVREAPDFSLVANPNAFSIEQGMSGQTAITITRTDFIASDNAVVILSLTGEPAGMTGTFDPEGPDGDTSTLTIDVDVSVPPGTYDVTVEGSSQNVAMVDPVRTAALAITVTAAPPSYTMSLDPDALTIEQGDQGTVDVSLSRINFSDAVALTLDGAPTGVTGVFNPAAPTGDASTLTLTVGAAVAPGVYNLTVRGTAAGLEDRTAALTLTVGNFSIAVDPNVLTIQQGMSDQATVTISRTNFTGEVSLSLTGAPNGVTGTFDPQATTGTTSTLTVMVDQTTVPGTYEMTVVGSSGAGSAQGVSAAVDMEATLTLTVEEVPSYSLDVEPPSLTIEQGQSGMAAVSITRTNFTEAVTLSLNGAPTGMTGTFDPPAPTDNTSTLTVMVDATVPAGDYNVTIDGASSIDDDSTPLTVTVTAAPDFSLSLNPAALSIEQGQNGQTFVSVTRTNFTGDVTLSLEDAPTGVTGVFNPNPATGASSTLTISVDGSVPAATYNLRVDGVGDPGTRSANLELTVTAPPPGFSLSMTPSGATVPQGGATSATINITRTGGFSDNVALSVTGMPSGMTAAPTPASTTGNSATLDVSVGSGVTPGTYPLTVAGDATGFPQATTTFTVTVTEAGSGSMVTVDFSMCEAADKAIWLAFEDGGGGSSSRRTSAQRGVWTQVTGVMDVYTFTLNSTKGGLAWVVEDTNGDRAVSVFYASAAQASSEPLIFCSPPGKTVNFTVSGMDMGDAAQVFLGDTPASSFVFADGPYQFEDVDPGAQNLVAFKAMGSDPSMNASMVVRRGLDIADMGSAGTVDFTGMDAFTPGSGTVTVAGMSVNDATFATFEYATPGSCQTAQIQPLAGVSFPVSGATFDVFGNPSPAAGDRHVATVTAFPNTMNPDRFRSVTDSRNGLGGFTLTLPPEMASPTVTPQLGNNYLRLNGTLQLANEYDAVAMFLYTNDDGDRTVSISATQEYLETQMPTLGLDDFSGVTGWIDDFAPASTDMVTWNAIGHGAAFLGDVCTVSTSASATRIGTFP